MLLGKCNVSAYVIYLFYLIYIMALKGIISQKCGELELVRSVMRAAVMACGILFMALCKAERP